MRSALLVHSGGLHPPVAFDVVSNGGEMDLALGLGEPELRRAAKDLASKYPSEDLLKIYLAAL